MPKFGNITNPSADIVKEIRTVAKMGFDYAEIAIEEPMGTPELLRKNKSAILKSLKKYNMFSLGHAPWWAELGSLNQLVRRRWINQIKAVIDIASEIGAKKLTVHLEIRGVAANNKKSRDQALHNYIDSIKTLQAHSKGVLLVLENTPNNSLEEFKYVVKNTEVAVNFDVGHAFIQGGMGEVKRYIKTFGKKIRHLHFHDNGGMRDEHLGIGFGKIDFKAVAKEIKEIGYDDTITFEIFFPGRAFAKTSKEILKKMW
ncbi:MAG: sugar phosphate isomerase/epimerase family protein [Candidatus Aenigmatarchaeota archaeon]